MPSLCLLCKYKITLMLPLFLWLKGKIYLRKPFLHKKILFHRVAPYSWKLPRKLSKRRNAENAGWALIILTRKQWNFLGSSLLPSCMAQRAGSGAILVTPNSVPLCPGQHRGSHIGPVQVWQSLLTGLCAILLRIHPLVGNINVSFSQIYLVGISVLSIGELPCILPV